MVVMLTASITSLATQTAASAHPLATSTPAPHASAAAFVARQSVRQSVRRSVRQAVSAYIKHRAGAISAAVYDDVSRRLVVVRPEVRGRTASIVKVDILEALLHKTHGDLTVDQRATATTMIERSDNAAAMKLWKEDGRAPGVHAYNDDLGLDQTDPEFHWGLTTTSAADQVMLVRALLRSSQLLSNSGRRFERRLMRHVDADQRWGISGGLPSDVTFGIKDGWLPVPQDHYRWAVNSIGWVRGDGKRYEIAVLTQHDDTERYGIRTIEHIAALVWDHVSVTRRGWGGAFTRVA